MTTPIRKLDGVIYWVIEEPNEIYDFINTEVRKEWIGDAKDEGRNLAEDIWLLELAKRKWQLEILQLKEIKPNPYVFIPRTGYNFEERLAKRSQDLRRIIETYGTVIWPVIVRGEDMLLVDGYCRLTTLEAMRVPRIYAYVGRF